MGDIHHKFHCRSCDSKEGSEKTKPRVKNLNTNNINKLTKNIFQLIFNRNMYITQICRAVITIKMAAIEMTETQRKEFDS